ncbi:MAG: PTS sugar transporter subunit IIB [Acholeplasmatales bacterium]|jgi:PTS system ascorbate-specific IIB component|nr:PTS sugar transporter subunit IIB [Acholeplasmatales bacterium]
MVKVLCACASGSGSSLLMEMATKKALKSLGLLDKDIYVQHCPLGEAKGQYKNYNILLVGKNFVSTFADAISKGANVIGIVNMMSDKEISEAIKKSLVLEKLGY